MVDASSPASALLRISKKLMFNFCHCHAFQSKVGKLVKFRGALSCISATF